LKLSKKADNIILRVRSMTDEDITSYLAGIDCPPHVNRLYDWWTWRGMKIPKRPAFLLAILGYDCNKSYEIASLNWRELNVEYQPGAYDGVLVEHNTRGAVMEI
jgi:hypothetical protein